MAHLRALKHTSVSGRLMDKGALLRPCKQTKPHPLPQARLVISAMAADGSRPGGRARSPSPQGSPLENAAAPPQSPDVERPSNGAGGRMSSSASIEEPPSIPNSVLERPSGGSSRVSMSDGSNGIPGGNGRLLEAPAHLGRPVRFLSERCMAWEQELCASLPFCPKLLRQSKQSLTIDAVPLLPATL